MELIEAIQDVHRNLLPGYLGIELIEASALAQLLKVKKSLPSTHEKSQGKVRFFTICSFYSQNCLKNGQATAPRLKPVSLVYRIWPPSLCVRASTVQNITSTPSSH